MDSSQEKTGKPPGKSKTRVGKLFRLGWKTIAVGVILSVVLLVCVKFLLVVGVLRPWLDKTASQIADFPIRVNSCDLGLMGTTCVQKVDVFETDLENQYLG